MERGSRSVSGSGDPALREASWLQQKVREAAAAKLMGTRWFARHVLIERWFLHQAQPALPARFGAAPGHTRPYAGCRAGRKLIDRSAPTRD